jgi:hypothetical protein
MNNDDLPHKQTMWVGIWKQIASFAVGVIVASFVLGSARQKMSDMQKWKEEINPRIERMDSVGSLSFDHFHKQYEKDQTKIEKRLDKLEESTKKLTYEQ